MKLKILLVLLLALPFVARAQNQDLQQLQNSLKQMQQMITNLQQEVIELKKQRVTPVQPGEAPRPEGAVEFVAPTIKTPPKASQAVPHETMATDYQEAAQRPASVTLDPKFKGYIPIPNTPAFVKFNAKVHVDSTYDSQNSGNKDRFTPALIPVTSQPEHGGGKQFNINARGSSLSVDVRAPDVAGDPRFYYNNDFFGGGVNNGMGYRLKQMYGQFFNVTAGFTFSVFEDPDVWPDTVDYEGPN